MIKPKHFPKRIDVNGGRHLWMEEVPRWQGDTAHRVHWLASGAIGLMALLLVGCASPVPVQPLGTAAPFGHDATLIYVPGIGGRGSSDAAWMRGLRAGGYDGKIEIIDWTGPIDPIAALWDHRLHRRQARLIADRIRGLRTAGPGAPIILVGHSAGAGLVVLALEDLPQGTQVDDMMLLAPALSRTYDLTAALRHVQGRADVFTSDRDTLVLGIGTSIFGTVDGAHGDAAGHAGFVRPRRAPGELYAKLHTHPFSDARQSLGDDGGHFGVLSSNVATALVAPLLPRPQIPPASAVETNSATHHPYPLVSSAQ
jgi:pimeloyl-ACP methyl ester carboxylesterase